MFPSLSSRAVPIEALSARAVAAMFRVFRENFEGASRAIFDRDLETKNWVILLEDARTAALQGFSTLALYETGVEGRPVSVVYSGDTIIRPEYWGTPELPRSWIHTVLEKSAGMPQPLYWLLISSGYKTYRFLTIFFKDFYPRHDRSTPPDVQRLIDRLASERFGSDYHCEDGVVRFAVGSTPLRAGVAEVSEERLRDPHIAFFVARNPGHANGDELVCLTRVHPDNFTRAGARMAR